MKKINPSNHFVICIDNCDYPSSLELHKVYTIIPDERAAEDDFLRVVDESGEDYLYAAKRFVPVDLPQQVKQSVMRRAHEAMKLANKTLQPPSRAQGSVNSK